MAKFNGIGTQPDKVERPEDFVHIVVRRRQRDEIRARKVSQSQSDLEIIEDLLYPKAK